MMKALAISALVLSGGLLFLSGCPSGGGSGGTTKPTAKPTAKATSTAAAADEGDPSMDKEDIPVTEDFEDEAEKGVTDDNFESQLDDEEKKDKTLDGDGADKKD